MKSPFAHGFFVSLHPRSSTYMTDTITLGKFASGQKLVQLDSFWKIVWGIQVDPNQSMATQK